MLWHLVDEVVETVREMPEGAPERAIIGGFEARGISPGVFYGIPTELESAGLVRRRGKRVSAVAPARKGLTTVQVVDEIACFPRKPAAFFLSLIPQDSCQLIMPKAH